MSVINQVLLDLEHRRASGAERGNLPNHVRVLPQAAEKARKRRNAILAVALLLAVAWAAFNAVDWSGSRPEEGGAARPRPAPPIAKAIVPKDEAAPSPAGATPAPAPAAEMQLAARLSFELSRLPEPLPEPQTRPAIDGAISSDRVIAKAPAEARAVRATAVETRPPEPKRAAQNVARREPSPAAGRDAAPAADPGGIDKRVRQPTAQQLAEGEFRKAMALLQHGRIEQAREELEAALSRHPGHHNARQALLGVLVETKRNAEAERVMQEGLQIAPHQIGFAIALARLQVDRGDSQAAIATLQKSAGYARESGDYLAFLAGLLQRQQRNAEAVEQFQSALRVRPDNGVWLLGLGLSLQAVGRDAEARDAFQRATATATLGADLRALAEQRLQRLQ